MSSLLDYYINQLGQGRGGLGELGGLSIKSLKGLCHDMIFLWPVYALVVFIFFFSLKINCKF
jgi:hypothetical protein